MTLRPFLFSIAFILCTLCGCSSEAEEKQSVSAGLFSTEDYLTTLKTHFGESQVRIKKTVSFDGKEETRSFSNYDIVSDLEKLLFAYNIDQIINIGLYERTEEKGSVTYLAVDKKAKVNKIVHSGIELLVERDVPSVLQTKTEMISVTNSGYRLLIEQINKDEKKSQKIIEVEVL